MTIFTKTTSRYSLVETASYTVGVLFGRSYLNIHRFMICKRYNVYIKRSRQPSLLSKRATVGILTSVSYEAFRTSLVLFPPVCNLKYIHTLLCSYVAPKCHKYCAKSTTTKVAKYSSHKSHSALSGRQQN